MLFINKVDIDLSNDEIVLNLTNNSIDISINYTSISNIGIELNPDIDYGNPYIFNIFNKFEVIKNILEGNVIDKIDIYDNDFRFYIFKKNDENLLKIIYNLNTNHKGWTYNNLKLELKEIIN